MVTPSGDVDPPLSQKRNYLIKGWDAAKKVPGLCSGAETSSITQQIMAQIERIYPVCGVVSLL